MFLVFHPHPHLSLSTLSVLRTIPSIISLISPQPRLARGGGELAGLALALTRLPAQVGSTRARV